MSLTNEGTNVIIRCRDSWFTRVAQSRLVFWRARAARPTLLARGAIFHGANEKADFVARKWAAGKSNQLRSANDRGMPVICTAARPSS